MADLTSPRVTFWGAAHTVTGSMHLVEAGGQRVLLDCGIYQGKRDEAQRINSTFPFKPNEINTVIISHAHTDHIGNLPNLVRQGFNGAVYCTPATRDLMAVMLEDSIKIQEEDAFYINKKRPKGAPLIQPLFTRPDVIRTMRLVQSIPYHKPCEMPGKITVQFLDAGHLLGSAMVHLDLPGGKSITFTGDLGRRGLPILRDPEAVPAADLLISESTYGGRDHPKVEDLPDEIAAVIRRTFARGGKMLIPAFSLGRTQSIIWFLHRLISEKKLDRVPVFVDSPLATAATEVFRLHPECFDEETARLLSDQPDLFGHQLVTYTRSVEESKALNARTEPCIIIAASGMCETGRILHHLKHNVGDPRATIAIIGYQAPNTLGRRIVEKKPELRIHDGVFPLKAEVVVMNGFSSHADRGDFDSFLGPLAGKVKKVRLVHGEPDQAEALKTRLLAMGFKDVVYPNRGDLVEV